MCSFYLQLVCDRSTLYASGCAAGRAFPHYTVKSLSKEQLKSRSEALLLYISPDPAGAPLSVDEAHSLNAAINGTLALPVSDRNLLGKLHIYF